MTTGQRSMCNNAACDVAMTGTCDRHFDPVETCPEYSDTEIEELDQGHDSEDVDVLPELADESILLRPNGLVKEDEITKFRNRAKMRTIALVGEQRAGKTTLLAAIYGLLCKGPLGAFSFEGSHTLRGFAERNHLALVSSKREAPTTPRTSRADPLGFFHLKLRTATGRSVEIVVSDRSGEAFEAARTDTGLVQRLQEFSLADRVCFLLDAARLTNIETRASYMRTFKQLIRALRDNNALRMGVAVEVLVTKLDRITIEESGRDLEKEVASYEKELRDEFSQSLHEFAIYRVCALPRANVKLGFIGIDELVERWTKGPTDLSISPRPVEQPHRMIDQLLRIWS